jgi:hypothetical protein
MPRRFPVALLITSGLLLAACSSAGTHVGSKASADEGDPNDPSNADAAATDDASPDASATPDASPDASPDAAPTTESCYALFHWLQKDAYKNTGGRTDPAWPPHTTTVLEVHCVDGSGNDSIVGTAFRDNHGTDPGTVDANGRSMLDEVKVSDPAPGTRDQLLGLLSTYTQCECAPATQFLSMTSAEGAVEQQILSTVVGYIQANLQCSGAVSTSGLVGMIQNGDFDDAIAALPSCTWANGADWSDGLTQATQTVASSLGQTLASYHVCNNDAMLEAQLFSSFVSTGNVVACDNTTPTCQGPAWFYNP